LAHAAVLSLHALCCGLPALAMLAAAVSGVAASITLLADFIAPFHAFMHQHEIWVLLVSALLVAAGGGLEAWARLRPHRHGFPWLFAFSAACLLANVAIIISHRAGS
jgi:UDP-N-acetylmuramyl pentapeptide phosphotransferase/UDP-N-acetylglucosamine-1-phosphate transferase